MNWRAKQLIEALTFPPGLVNVTVTADFMARQRDLAMYLADDSERDARRLDWLQKNVPELEGQVARIGLLPEEELSRKVHGLRRAVDVAMWREFRDSDAGSSADPT